MNSAAHGRNLRADRVDGKRFGSQELVDRDAQRDPAAGNRRRARAPVGLEHVAVDDDLTLTELGQIDHGAERAADQPLDLLRSARLLALCCLAIAPGMGGAGEHSIFGGDPALALTPQEGRDLLFYA